MSGCKEGSLAGQVLQPAGKEVSREAMIQAL